MKHIIKVEDLENLPKTRLIIAMDNNNNLIWKLDGTKIWYTTTDSNKYDLGGIIEMLVGDGAIYNGPAIVSNEYDGVKQMWCMKFDNDVTILGDLNGETMQVEGPFFVDPSGVSCNVETIILPKTINRIGVRTFYNCSSLTSMTIPNSVTSIGESAFYGCTSLSSVTISNSVTSIGDTVFYGCTSLTSITIPISVTSIGYGAFYDCNGLTSMTIPNSVTSIGDWAFYGCSSLTSITCKSITPPTLGGTYVFNNTNCPIYVPVDSVEIYKTAENWSTYADRIYTIQ